MRIGSGPIPIQPKVRIGRVGYGFADWVSQSICGCLRTLFVSPRKNLAYTLEVKTSRSNEKATDSFDKRSVICVAMEVVSRWTISEAESELIWQKTLRLLDLTSRAFCSAPV
jgi:hypothetical protein